MKSLFEKLRLTKFQVAVHLASWGPLALLLLDYFRDNLTVNPIQALTLRTGKYALVWLVLSLACTPLNTVFGFRAALKVRRALGLYAFMYAGLHFLIFSGLDYQFNLSLLKGAIFEKPFVIVGLTALLILIALAITSTRGWMKRLGKGWTRLHKLVYAAGLLVVVHYTWAVKSDIRVPLLFGGIVMLLLALRLGPVRQALARWRLLSALRAYLGGSRARRPVKKVQPKEKPV